MLAMALFTHLFTFLALLLAPLVMAGGHAAAMPVKAAGAADHGGHCAEMAPSGSKEAPVDRGASIDCAIACACVQAFAHRISDRVQLAAVYPPEPARNFAVSRNPAADPPPPRLS
jgi:hypothetical protein